MTRKMQRTSGTYFQEISVARAPASITLTQIGFHRLNNILLGFLLGRGGFPGTGVIH